MQKEIYEQPTALINTMEGRINHENDCRSQSVMVQKAFRKS